MFTDTFFFIFLYCHVPVSFFIEYKLRRRGKNTTPPDSHVREFSAGCQPRHSVKVSFRCRYIKSPAWTAAFLPAAGRDIQLKCLYVMGFILSHIQHNFLRCSHTEDISTLDIIINEKRMFVKCHNKLFIIHVIAYSIIICCYVIFSRLYFIIIFPDLGRQSNVHNSHPLAAQYCFNCSSSFEK